MQDVPNFNDDIQSTAGAIVAAVLGTLKFQGVVPLVRQRFLFLGAGQVSIGGARLLQEALKAEGLSSEDARSRIWLFDSKASHFGDLHWYMEFPDTPLACEFSFRE